MSRIETIEVPAELGDVSELFPAAGRPENERGDEPPPPQSPEDYGTESRPKKNDSPSTAPPLETFSAADFDGLEVPPRLWVYPGLMPAGEGGLMNAHGGVGKTLLALQLSVGCVLGTDAAGFLCEAGGPVIFFSAEERRDELHRRLAAILARSQRSFQELRHLQIYCCSGADAFLSTCDKNGKVTPTLTFARLEAAVKRDKPALVFIDNVAMTFGGSENLREIVVQNIGLMNGLTVGGGAAWALQHVSKSGMVTDGSSGSTGWHNHVRARAWLTFPNDKELGPGDAERDLRELHPSMKQNYGPRGGKMTLRWENGLFVPDTGAPTPARLSAEANRNNLFLDLLDKFTASGREVRPSTGRNYAPAEFAKDPGAGGLNRKALEAAMSALFADGTIRVERRGPDSKSRQAIVRARLFNGEAGHG